jgi:hypothetical protein
VDGAINTISFPLVDVEFLKASTVDVKDISGNDAVIFILLLMSLCMSVVKLPTMHWKRLRKGLFRPGKVKVKISIYILLTNVLTRKEGLSWS